MGATRGCTQHLAAAEEQARLQSRGHRRFVGPRSRKERDLARFDLADFLAKTGTSLNRLASYLRVAPSYLEAALEGTGRLTTRDQQACRLLWRRLFRAKQLDLPFAESPDTFSRSHARERARARDRVTKPSGRVATKPRRRARRGATIPRP